MEENEVKERPLMDLDEFKDYVSIGDDYKIYNYSGNSRFKSLRRAMRRGLVSSYGTIAPKRPFNNRANTCKRGKHSRVVNENKKAIYGQYREYQSKRV